MTPAAALYQPALRALTFVAVFVCELLIHTDVNQ